MKEKSYDYITKNGLRVTYIYKPDFMTSYAGIGVNYGSRDVIFYDESHNKITSKKGVAHFIEHKLFSMPEMDAFAKFSDLNASANAYTDTEKTIYYFTTASDLYAPLDLLLSMYFTPYFVEEEIENEKSIIISEIKMHHDDIQSQFFHKAMKSLYPKNHILDEAAGTIQSVSNTQIEDLNIAYDSFYTTDNSFLVIISHEPKEKVFSFLDNALKKLPIRRGIPIRNACKLISGDIPDTIMNASVEQTTAALTLRFSIGYEDKMICSMMIGILDSLFSPMSAYYKKLYKSELFFSDIDYSITSLSDTSYCIISTNTNHPEEFLNEIEEKLKSITKKDIDKKITELYIKHLLSKAIMLKDDMQELGEEVLILALEGTSLQEIENLQSRLKVEDFYAYLSYFHSATYGKAICKKSEKSI